MARADDLAKNAKEDEIKIGSVEGVRYKPDLRGNDFYSDLQSCDKSVVWTWLDEAGAHHSLKLKADEYIWHPNWLGHTRQGPTYKLKIEYVCISADQMKKRESVLELADFNAFPLIDPSNKSKLAKAIAVLHRVRRPISDIKLENMEDSYFVKNPNAGKVHYRDFGHLAGGSKYAIEESEWDLEKQLKKPETSDNFDKLLKEMMSLAAGHQPRKVQR